MALGGTIIRRMALIREPGTIYSFSYNSEAIDTGGFNRKANHQMFDCATLKSCNYMPDEMQIY